MEIPVISSISRLCHHLPVNANWELGSPATGFQAAHRAGLPKHHWFPYSPATALQSWQSPVKCCFHWEAAGTREHIYFRSKMFVVSRMKLSQNFWLAEKFLFISQINLNQNPTQKKWRKQDFPWTRNSVLQPVYTGKKWKGEKEGGILLTSINLLETFILPDLFSCSQRCW